MFPRLFRRKQRTRRVQKGNAHYLAHKERARVLVHERLAYWALRYGVVYRRVSIRDQRSRWGSCSRVGNLNFNYRIVFLPPELVDYIVVHELCHLIEFNHSPSFWNKVAETIPNHHLHRQALRTLSQSVFQY